MGYVFCGVLSYHLAALSPALPAVLSRFLVFPLYDFTKGYFPMYFTHKAAPLLALLACAGLAAVPAAAQTYTLTGLGTLGGYSSGGYGVNASGQVTGYSMSFLSMTTAEVMGLIRSSMSALAARRLPTRRLSPRWAA